MAEVHLSQRRYSGNDKKKQQQQKNTFQLINHAAFCRAVLNKVVETS